MPTRTKETVMGWRKDAKKYCSEYYEGYLMCKRELKELKKLQKKLLKYQRLLANEAKGHAYELIAEGDISLLTICLVANLTKENLDPLKGGEYSLLKYYLKEVDYLFWKNHLRIEFKGLKGVDKDVYASGLIEGMSEVYTSMEFSKGREEAV